MSIRDDVGFTERLEHYAMSVYFNAKGQKSPYEREQNTPKALAELIDYIDEYVKMTDKKKIYVVMLSIGQYPNTENRPFKAFYDTWDAQEFVGKISRKIESIKSDDENRVYKYYEIIEKPEGYLPKHFPSYMKLSFYTVCDVQLN